MNVQKSAKNKQTPYAQVCIKGVSQRNNNGTNRCSAFAVVETILVIVVDACLPDMSKAELDPKRIECALHVTGFGAEAYSQNMTVS